MIKVRYDETTGKIGKSYPEVMDIPQPFFEMSEVDHDELRVIVLKDGEDLFFRNVGFVVERDVERARQAFYKDFIKTSKGCIRLETKVGPFISVLPNYTNMVQAIGLLPAKSLLFYEEPDFAVENPPIDQFWNEEMTAAEYQLFFAEVMAEYKKIFVEGQQVAK